jgi:hypothetical protein
MFTRRAMLATLAALSGSAFATRSFASPADLKTAARDAWIYGLPLIEMAHTRAKMAKDGARASAVTVNAARINAFVHSRVFAGPQSRAVTAPNVDTLYSSTFLDLAGGPITLTLPPTGSRYFSVAFMDMYTNNFAILGTRTIGGDGGTFAIIGPDAAPVPGAIRSPTVWVWALMRLLATDEADFPAAHAIQDAVILKASPGRLPQSYAERTAPWAEYFGSLQALLNENPPPVTDLALFRRVAALGLGPSGGFGPARFSAAQATDIAAGVAEAQAFVRNRGKPRGIQGWVYPPTDLGDFGQDYTTRAFVALGGLAALTNPEAIYMRPLAPDGEFGDSLYRLHFAAGGLPPVGSFWSLTMYEATPDGQFFLTPNALHRYAIGDRTRGLNYGADGSLDIWISRTDPGGERSANWLPAPARGPYSMSLRAYLPKPAFFNGEYRLPPIEKA